MSVSFELNGFRIAIFDIMMIERIRDFLDRPCVLRFWLNISRMVIVLSVHIWRD